MNYTLKFPNWRKASVAAAHHVTAFFSPWRCCLCLPFFCPSDCHHKWHFMHSWTTLSKGLCIHLLRIFDVKLGRSREENQEVQQIHNQNNTEKKILHLLDLKRRGLFAIIFTPVYFNTWRVVEHWYHMKTTAFHAGVSTWRPQTIFRIRLLCC